MNPTSPLSVQNLTKIYPSPEKPLTAVDHVSFELKHGEILGLLGPNGAGKTTTIQMLLSTLKPTDGSIKYFGKDFFKYRSECLQDVGFASTYINLPGDLTVEENLKIYGLLYGLSSSTLRDNITQFLKRFDIESFRQKKVNTLSAGQKTRVMLCKAFLAHPKIVLLDEPTASLDPDIAHEVREFVLHQQREHGVSVLFTSHNMDEVAYVCQRVLVLAKGKIIADDSPEKLAASVDISKVQLVVGDGLKRTIAYVSEHHLEYSLHERSIEIKIDEHKIAELLQNLAHIGIQYTQIFIEKPTLEDYFLKISKMRENKE
jgi:ABC-2 type transport system ATP-binding protein